MIDIADKLNNMAFSGIASGLNKINQSNQYTGMVLNYAGRALDSLEAAQNTKQYNNDILNNMESNIYYKDVPLEHTLKSSVPSGIVFGKNTAYGTTEQSKAYLKNNKLKYRGSRYGKE